MGDVKLHNTSPDELSEKIELNIANADKADSQRAEDRAAKELENAKDHNEVIQKIYADVQAAAERTLV